MKIKKIFLKNIRSYENEEIEFPNGSILLAGDIGTGKTSLLLAIEYALFGLQPGQKGSSLLRNNTDFGEVKIEFELNDDKINIVRRLKRKNKSVTNEYASFTKNGEKIELSLTETKIKILEALGYPQELVRKNNMLYRYTVYAPQEQMKQIILEDSESRLNILRQILGIDKYKRIRENLIIIINYIKENSKFLQGEIKSLDDEKTKIEFKKNRLDEVELQMKKTLLQLEQKKNSKRLMESESSKIEEKIQEKINFEKELEKTKIMISTKFESLSSVDSEILEIESTIKNSKAQFKEEEYLEILNLIGKKDQKIDLLNEKYAQFIGHMNSIENQQTDTINKKERIFKIDFCPTCLQDVPEIHKHNIVNETENLLSKLKKNKKLIEKEISNLSEVLNLEKIQKSLLEDKKSSLEILRTRLEYLQKTKEKLINVENIKKNLENDLLFLNKHFNALKDQILSFHKYEKLWKIKKEEILIISSHERNEEISIAELNKESDLTKKEITELEESIKKKEISKQKLSTFLELNDWLSTSFINLIEFTESNILLKIRQEFSQIFSKWFQMLSSQESLIVRLDESFSPIIMHNETEMDYNCISGGERTAIALAYRLALNQTLNSILSNLKTKDIVMLDEPTDGFSDTQLDRMRDVFEELNVSQLIIVSHEQKIESFLQNIIRLKKNGNTTYVDSFDDPTKKLKYPETFKPS